MESLPCNEVVEIELQLFPDLLVERLLRRHAVFVDANSLMIDVDVGGNFLGPTATVVVLDSITPEAQRLVRVSAENALRAFGSRMQKSSVRHLGRKPQIRGVKPLQKADHALLAK